MKSFNKFQIFWYFFYFRAFFLPQSKLFSLSACNSKTFLYLCSMNLNTEFLEDEIFGDRLLVSVRADQTELNDNIRVARVLLRCFDDMYIIINEHLLTIGHKNPEYTINGKLGDR